MIYALEFDDGNSYYGDVEVLTTNIQEVYDFIIQSSSSTLDGTGYEYIQFDVDESWRPRPIDENGEFASMTELVLREYSPAANGRCSMRGYAFKYTGPRGIEHIDQLIRWLSEFSDDRYNLTTREDTK